jgi:Tol biopolymer transport system component
MRWNLCLLVSSVVLAVSVVAGCGGGSSDVGPATGTNPPDTSNPPPAINATSDSILSYGRVWSVGSDGGVGVNEFYYAALGADVVVDGRAGSPADIGVGDIVSIEGTVRPSGATARRVKLDHVVQGRVDGIDHRTRTLFVLGQKVLVGHEQLGNALPDLLVGESISVSGLRTAQGHIVATRLKRQPASEPVVFKTAGAVTALTADLKRLAINGLEVDYAAATMTPNTAAALAQGVFIEVKGTPLAGGLLAATSVEVKRQGVSAAAGTRIQIAGYVTQLDGNGTSPQLQVDGFPVLMSGATAEPAPALDVLMQVQGRVNAEGASRAEQLFTQAASPPSDLPCLDLGPLSAPPPVKRIAFVSARDGNEEIYAVHGDGSGLVRLTDHPAWDARPAWSPDGTRIAFVSDRSGIAQIYVMTANGSQVVRRTFGGAAAGSPSWSPDGSRITYTSLANGSNAVWSVGADCATTPAPLFNLPGFEAEPVWSPDGTQLALVSDWAAYDMRYDIYLIKPDGTGLTLLTAGSAEYWQPSWSPDGTKIATLITRAVGINQYESTLGVMNADGSGLTPLIPAASWTKNSWSPDGARIAFTRADGATRSVAWVAADGSGASGTIVADGWDPDWQR